MVVDFLHSFYSKSVNIWIAGVKTPATIRWYRAPAGAKILPFPHSFFSRVWDNDYEHYLDEPGEATRFGRTWDAGRNPGYQGQCYRGDPEWFQTGQLPPLESIPPSDCLCQLPPLQSTGGIILGGSALVSSTVCQQQGTRVVYVDALDGNGPQPWPFRTTIATVRIYAPRAISLQAFPAVGLPSNPLATLCISTGVWFLGGNPPVNPEYIATGALHYLFDAHFAQWDFENDGRFVGNVYTRIP